ncbi:MAG: hypothetical protein Q8L47_03485 [bacterium]|nr:hypothetical protein [bacterium]
MDIEIKKSYNPFKMWGSWVSFGIGTIGTLIYVSGSSFVLRDYTTGLSVGINPLIYLVGWPIPPVVLTTPLVTFLYGWAIHSIFRKLAK